MTVSSLSQRGLLSDESRAVMVGLPPKPRHERLYHKFHNYTFTPVYLLGDLLNITLAAKIKLGLGVPWCLYWQWSIEESVEQIVDDIEIANSLTKVFYKSLIQWCLYTRLYRRFTVKVLLLKIYSKSHLKSDYILSLDCDDLQV